MGHNKVQGLNEMIYGLLTIIIIMTLVICYWIQNHPVNAASDMVLVYETIVTFSLIWGGYHVSHGGVLYQTSLDCEKENPVEQ